MHIFPALPLGVLQLLSRGMKEEAGGRQRCEGVGEIGEDVSVGWKGERDGKEGKGERDGRRGGESEGWKGGGGVRWNGGGVRGGRRNEGTKSG